MNPKLKLCCAVLAAFSAMLSCPHGTLPSSLNGVTALLLFGCGAACPNPVCVAYNLTARIGRKEAGYLNKRKGLVIEIEFIFTQVIYLNESRVACTQVSFDDFRVKLQAGCGE